MSRSVVDPLQWSSEPLQQKWRRNEPWGSGRAAVDNFQNGEWGWGILNSALTLTDVFMVKSLVMGVGKALFQAGV